nr:hypothetical protein [uncultured Desulfobacter sp.]
MTINLKNFGVWITASLALVIFLVTAGCGFHTAGHMKHRTELMDQYRKKTLPEKLSYFYCGRENLPYAVVGIDPAYSFETKFWFPIEYGPDLYDKIDHLSNLEPGQTRRFARAILGPAGNTIGVWFSYFHSTGIVVDDADSKIQVYNPYKPSSRQFRMHR